MNLYLKVPMNSYEKSYDKIPMTKNVNIQPGIVAQPVYISNTLDTN